MKIISDTNQELDAEVKIGYEDRLQGIFLKSRNGGNKNYKPRNTDYYLALIQQFSL